MSFEYEEKPSGSRFVDTIWRTYDTSDGTYLAAADACWDMIFIRSVHGNRALLSGPSTQITPVPYRAGNRNFGIRFHRGSFLTHVPTTAMVDTTDTLPMPTPDSFLLAGTEWPMPSYQTADEFVAELERLELLSDDPVVNAVLRGEPADTSIRSVQRRVSHVTGLTANRIRQIVRARRRPNVFAAANRSSMSRTTWVTPRWPAHVVADWSRGVPTSYARKLAETWGTRYDWKAQEAKLNTYPQFKATIDGQTIHFVHVRSKVAGATPLLLAHGYPSSFVEFTRMIGPLVDPEAHGGRAEDAFDVVIPSIPGFGFSDPAAPGFGVQRTAAAFDQIMQGLGYERYGVSGGDVGAGISAELCLIGQERIIGSLVVTDPGAIATEYTPPTDHLTDAEGARHAELKAARAEDFGYIALQTSRPQSIAYGLTDSPVTQLTWIVEKVKEWTDPAQELPEDAVELDHLLTIVSVYWFNQGGAGAANFLSEAAHTAASWGETHDRPQGFVSFGREPLVRRILDPEENLPYWNEHDAGGHFPAMEVPDLYVGDLRAFFAGLR